MCVCLSNAAFPVVAVIVAITAVLLFMLLYCLYTVIIIVIVVVFICTIVVWHIFAWLAMAFLLAAPLLRLRPLQLFRQPLRPASGKRSRNNLVGQMKMELTIKVQTVATIGIIQSFTV